MAFPFRHDAAGLIGVLPQVIEREIKPLQEGFDDLGGTLADDVTIDGQQIHNVPGDLANALDWTGLR